MPESHAEQLDPSVVGEQVGDDERAADSPPIAYPPEQPLGVEDPAIGEQGVIAPDDVATRDARRQVAGPDDVNPAGDESIGLIETGVDPDIFDGERTAIADQAPDGEQAPEAAAVRVDEN